MSDQRDRVSPVDQARMGNQDVLSRVAALETALARVQGQNIAANSLAEMTQDAGVLNVAGLYLGDGDPNDTTTLPTGLFLVNPSVTIGGKQFNLLSFLAGVLQAGITTSQGQVTSGNGAGVIDANGFRVYNGATEIGRFGDLNGFLTYITQTFGLALGDKNAYMTYDPSNGLRIKGTLAVFGTFPFGWDVWDEDIDGTPDGTIINFSVANAYVAGTLQIILNGIWLRGNRNDYAEGVANIIYMNYAPQTGDVITVNYIKASDLSTVSNETPVGSINGTNMTYTTAFNHVPGSLQVFLNDISLDFGDDYRNANRTFIFSSAIPPSTGDRIKAAYMVNANAKLVFQETPTGAINGVNTVYTTAHNYVAGSLFVIVNGLRQSITADYTESAANQFTMTTALLTGDSLWLTYTQV